MIRTFAVFVMLTCSVTAARADDLFDFVGEFIKVGAGPCEKVRTLDGRCTQFHFVTYRVAFALASFATQGELLDLWVTDDDLKSYAESRFTLVRAYGNPQSGYKAESIGGPDSFTVHRTRDGRFAHCGCPPAKSKYKAEQRLYRACTPIVFEPEIVEDLTHASAYWRQTIAKSGDYRVQGARAICTRGMEVSALVHAVDDERLE